MTNIEEVGRPKSEDRSWKTEDRSRHGPSARGEPAVRGKPLFTKCASTKMREYINVPIRGKPPLIGYWNVFIKGKPPLDIASRREKNKAILTGRKNLKWENYALEEEARWVLRFLNSDTYGTNCDFKSANRNSHHPKEESHPEESGFDYAQQSQFVRRSKEPFSLFTIYKERFYRERKKLAEERVAVDRMGVVVSEPRLQMCEMEFAPPERRKSRFAILMTNDN